MMTTINNNSSFNTIADLFDYLFDDSSDVREMRSTTPVYSGNFPPCNVYVNEESKDLALEFAVAGISEDKISLTTEGDYLYLEIDKHEREKKEFTVIQKGIKSSHIKRKFYIPMSRYHLESIDIKLTDGILELIIPAREEIKPKRLKING